jgi:hypothetical protein
MHLHCLTPCIEGCKQRGPLRHPFKTAPCIAEYSGAVGGQGFPISRHLPVLHHVHHTGVLRQPSLRRGGSSVLNPKREQIVDPVLCYMTWLRLTTLSGRMDSASLTGEGYGHRRVVIKLTSGPIWIASSMPFLACADVFKLE